jgi:hypothetical protein
MRSLRGSGFANDPVGAISCKIGVSGDIGAPSIITAPSVTDESTLLAERMSCGMCAALP